LQVGCRVGCALGLRVGEGLGLTLGAVGLLVGATHDHATKTNTEEDKVNGCGRSTRHKKTTQIVVFCLA